MLQVRVIPILLNDRDGLVKTLKFKDSIYVGDPLNAVRIFNNKFVDELILLDIGRSRDRIGPDFDLVNRVVSECFMPLGYGGGIRSLTDAKSLFAMGVEKVVLQTAALENSNIITEISEFGGSQSVSVSIDVILDKDSNYRIYHAAQKRILDLDIPKFISEIQNLGAGEVILTSVDREGTFSGYDLSLVSYFSNFMHVPLVVNGGASSIKDFALAIGSGADAVAAGSMFIFYRNRSGVLLNYPLLSEVEITQGGITFE
jgi:cyclase